MSEKKPDMQGDAKKAARERSQMLKKLREERAETVARTQTLLKEQKKMTREICKVIREQGKTVPEIAEATGYPTGEVLWHITALRKYDIVVETEMCGEYFQYKKVKEAR